MKKIWNRILMTAAAVVMAGSWTIPAQGAYVSFPVSGGGVVIAGGSGLDGLENWKDLADRIGAVLGKTAETGSPGGRKSRRSRTGLGRRRSRTGLGRRRSGPPGDAGGAEPARDPGPARLRGRREQWMSSPWK